jgi:hypothetical protein
MGVGFSMLYPGLLECLKAYQRVLGIDNDHINVVTN